MVCFVYKIVLSWGTTSYETEDLYNILCQIFTGFNLVGNYIAIFFAYLLASNLRLIYIMARKFYESERGHKCVHIQSDYNVIEGKKVVVTTLFSKFARKKKLNGRINHKTFSLNWKKKYFLFWFKTYL